MEKWAIIPLCKSWCICFHCSNIQKLEFQLCCKPLNYRENMCGSSKELNSLRLQALEFFMQMFVFKYWRVYKNLDGWACKGLLVFSVPTSVCLLLSVCLQLNCDDNIWSIKKISGNVCSMDASWSQAACSSPGWCRGLQGMGWIMGTFPGCTGAVPHCPKWQCWLISDQHAMYVKASEKVLGMCFLSNL